MEYRMKTHVDVHDVDFNGVCRFSSLLRYIQSTAQLQLTENGMSYDNLRNMNRAFIISRIKVEFDQPIYCYDRVEAETFPCVSRGYSFIRCYALYKGGVQVGRAISVWALIDTESRSLVKVNDFELGLETYPQNDMTIGHFRLPTTMAAVGKYTVVYADLDQNMHINNTRYADIFANFLPLSGKRIDSMTINYVNDAKYGEVLDVYLDRADGYYYIRTVKPDGKVNAEAEIHITDI